MNSSSIIELSGVNEKTDSNIEQIEENSLAEEDQAKEPDQIASASSSFVNEEESTAVQEETTIDETIDESTFSDADETVNETCEEIEPLEVQKSEKEEIRDGEVEQKSQSTEIRDNNESDEGILVTCTLIFHRLFCLSSSFL